VLCEKLVGGRAVELGIADFIAPDGQSYAEARALARRVAKLPDVAVKMSKEAINVTSNALNRLASFMARDQAALASQSTEAAAARAEFARRKKPRR
jgi:enoyl-CoA hydratase/carnithine racemase